MNCKISRKKKGIWLFRKNKKRESFSGELNYEKDNISAKQWVRYAGMGALLGILVCWLCYHSFFSFPIGVLIALFYLHRKKTEEKEKRRKELLYHFKDFLSALSTALSSGYSLENGIKKSLKDLQQLYKEEDVMVAEVKHMIIGLQLRKSVQELFEDLGERSGLEDIKLFAQLLAVSKRQGGNMGKLLSDTKRIICEKIETEQEIDKLLAAKIYEQKIMSIMPAAVIIYLRITFSGFIEQLYGNLLGVCIMSICLGVYAGAYLLGKKIVKIAI